jgi:hypothetical protein
MWVRLNGAGIAYFDEARTLDTAESVQSRVTQQNRPVVHNPIQEILIRILIGRQVIS